MHFIRPSPLQLGTKKYLFVEEPFLLNYTSKLVNYMLHWEFENLGTCSKNEVNQKKETGRKRESLCFLKKNKKLLKYFLWWFKIYIIFFFFFHDTESTPLLNNCIIFSFENLFGKCEITFILSCRVITKGHTDSNKPVVFLFKYVWPFVTTWHEKVKFVCTGCWGNTVVFTSNTSEQFYFKSAWNCDFHKKQIFFMGSQTKIFSMILRINFVPRQKKIAVIIAVRDILWYVLVFISKGI